jgi:quercetin dioxygenase-like cupin family protein
LDIVIKRHFTEAAEEIPSLTRTEGCTVRWLISKEHGAQRYAMRLFTLQSGGQIPLHEHEDTEHEIFIVEGQGMLDNGNERILVTKGDAIFVQPGEKHGFMNNTDRSLLFICVVPI